MIKVAAFDIGGTLMEYKGMPGVWIDYYENGFKHVREKLLPQISDDDIAAGMAILRGYNPTIKYREADYSHERIFGEIAQKWGTDISVDKIAYCFFEAFPLEAYTYPETIPVLYQLCTTGIKIATLTDVATGMPDELHKSYFPELMPYFDLYVSSTSCRYRKPNIKGLVDIAVHFGVKPDEMIFIGDERKDVLVANCFGCTSVYIDRYNNNRDFGQKYTVKNLNEFYDIVTKL